MSEVKNRQDELVKHFIKKFKRQSKQSLTANTVIGSIIASKGSKIIVKELQTGFMHEIDRMAVIKQIDPKKNLCEYQL